MKHYSFPLVVTLDVSGEMTHSELEKVRKVVVAELDYLLKEIDTVSDMVQVRIAVELHDMHIAEPNEPKVAN